MNREGLQDIAKLQICWVSQSNFSQNFLSFEAQMNFRLRSAPTAHNDVQFDQLNRELLRNRSGICKVVKFGILASFYNSS